MFFVSKGCNNNQSCYYKHMNIENKTTNENNTPACDTCGRSIAYEDDGICDACLELQHMCEYE